ncbi:MAG: hypothetical protein NVS4B2_05570 [Chloroflexota bacterium]
MGTVRPKLVSSLRWRLSTAISGAILLCTIMCIAASVLFLSQALKDRASSDLMRTLRSVPRYLQTQQDELVGQAQVVAADPRVIEAVRRQNDQALSISLLHFYEYLTPDLMDVVDRSGNVILREENLKAPTSNIAGLPSIRGALHMGTTGFYLESDSAKSGSIASYALRATVPIRSGSEIIGAVVVGRKPDSPFAQRIKSALSDNVNLIVANQRTGSTLLDANGLPVDGLPVRKETVRRIATGRISITSVNDAGSPTLSGLVPIAGDYGKPAGAIEVVTRLSPLYDLITQLSFLLVALGAAIVVAGALFALAISRRLTSRLQVLESTASHVAEMASFDAPMSEMRGVVAVRGDDEVASLARSFGAMMMALDQRMETNEQLYAAAQSRLRELTGLAEIARLLTAGPSIRETLHILGEEVCKLLGCSAVAIWLPGEGTLPPLYGGHGLPAFYEDLTHMAISENVDERYELTSQQTLRDGTVAFHRLDQAPRHLPQSHAALHQAAQDLGWGGATAVPLRVGDRIVGVLTCYTREVVPLPESDIGLLTTIADQVAVAVENARLYRQSRDLATLQERARLARDLHDSVTQALFSMTMHARAAQMSLDREGLDANGVLGRSLQQLSELTQGALAEMRALIFELRPGALAEEGLAAALRKQAVVLTMREGLAVRVEAPPDRLMIEETVEEHLYRLAQEALNNIVKHARASNVLVRLEHDPDTAELCVEIHDDGRGFDSTTVPPGHLGLGTMAERARLVGARFEVRSSAGKGTLVRVTLPGAVDTQQRHAVEQGVAS